MIYDELVSTACISVPTPISTIINKSEKVIKWSDWVYVGEWRIYNYLRSEMSKYIQGT